MKKTVIGLVGCGMISDAYFKAASRFRNIEISCCCDIFPERAAAKAELYNCRAVTLDELLADKSVEIVLNLTPPKIHNRIMMAALQADKHVYSEKPFGVDIDEAKAVIELAAKKGLRIGCAPDTFLGSGLQTARKALDDNWIGSIYSGTAIVQGRGPEKWGHAPFFYDTGAGPMLDLGPYYVTALVNLLGPVKAVTAVTKKSESSRTFAAEVSPEYQKLYQPYGEYPVNVDTHQTGILEFESGAVITVIASFEVFKHSHAPIELYGSQGSMQVPDPNTFGGEVRIFRPGMSDWETLPRPFGYADNSRSIGVADMAKAITENRPHRVCGELAFHVLEVMLSFKTSGDSGKRVEIQSRCSRPEPLPLGLDDGEI